MTDYIMKYSGQDWEPAENCENCKDKVNQYRQMCQCVDFVRSVGYGTTYTQNMQVC